MAANFAFLIFPPLGDIFAYHKMILNEMQVLVHTFLFLKVALAPNISQNAAFLDFCALKNFLFFFLHFVTKPIKSFFGFSFYFTQVAR